MFGINDQKRFFCHVCGMISKGAQPLQCIAVCRECCFNFYKTKFAEYSIQNKQDQQMFQCMCGIKHLDIHALLKTIQKSNQQTIQYLLTRRYLKYCQDSVPCPKCPNYMLVQRNNCDLNCPACNTVIYQVKQESLLSQFLNVIQRTFRAQRCPFCMVYIIRSQGCNNMLCTMCGQGFCYGCCKSNNSLTHKQHECCLNQTLKLYCIILLLMDMSLCLMSVSTWQWIWEWIICIFLFLLCIGGLVGSFMLSVFKRPKISLIPQILYIVLMYYLQRDVWMLLAYFSLSISVILKLIMN